MITTINLKDFGRIVGLSHYNYNVYKNITNDTYILEKCVDCDTFYYYYYDVESGKEGDYLGYVEFDSIFDLSSDTIELDSSIW